MKPTLLFIALISAANMIHAQSTDYWNCADWPAGDASKGKATGEATVCFNCRDNKFVVPSDISAGSKSINYEYHGDSAITVTGIGLQDIDTGDFAIVKLDKPILVERGKKLDLGQMQFQVRHNPRNQSLKLPSLAIRLAL